MFRCQLLLVTAHIWSNFIATSHDQKPQDVAFWKGNWGPLFQWKARLVKDYYLARYIVKSTVVLFFLQNFTYKKRVWGKLQTIPYSMSYTYNIQEIYFQMIQIDLFQETIKYKPPTSSFSNPFPFSRRLSTTVGFLVGFSRFSPWHPSSSVFGSFFKVQSCEVLCHCWATKWASAKWPKSWVFRRDMRLLEVDGSKGSSWWNQKNREKVELFHPYLQELWLYKSIYNYRFPFISGEGAHPTYSDIRRTRMFSL